MTGSKILVVEDEAIVALDIGSMLEDLGYSAVPVARSGQEAIQTVAETNPDLVLMDIRLQGAMDGIEAAGHIRDSFSTPVVYLTAHTDKGILE